MFKLRNFQTYKSGTILKLMSYFDTSLWEIFWPLRRNCIIVDGSDANGNLDFALDIVKNCKQRIYEHDEFDLFARSGPPAIVSFKILNGDDPLVRKWADIDNNMS